MALGAPEWFGHMLQILNRDAVAVVGNRDRNINALWQNCPVRF